MRIQHLLCTQRPSTVKLCQTSEWETQGNANPTIYLEINPVRVSNSITLNSNTNVLFPLEKILSWYFVSMWSQNSKNLIYSSESHIFKRKKKKANSEICSFVTSKLYYLSDVNRHLVIFSSPYIMSLHTCEKKKSKKVCLQDHMCLSVTSFTSFSSV